MLVRIENARDIAAGQMRVFDVAGIKVNIASIGGQFRAFDDTCTHRACSLAKGKLDGTTVTWPCHGSQFDVTTGEVIRGPAQQPVRSHIVQMEDEGLLIES
ncbi:MAG TPA: Rieske 2Fe-2S domain-containing protein [Pyrinomonadaceae bacterium]